MSDIDTLLAPQGFRAREQTHDEVWPLMLPSCSGCAFAGSLLRECFDRPCSRFGRPDGQSVVFEKITPEEK